jgi:peptidoglycan/LPS O-acetylase OafA/YrhL
VGIVAISPLLRLAVLLFPSSLRDIHAKTPLICDTFAMGALLAIVLRSPAWDTARLATLVRRLAATGAVLAIALASAARLRSTWGQDVARAGELSPYIFVFGAIILSSVHHPEIAFTRAGRSVAFLGEISYGLYLFHQFVFEAYNRVVQNSWLADIQHSPVALLLRLVVCASISIAIATVSRFKFEQRFLDLKARLAAH